MNNSASRLAIKLLVLLIEFLEAKGGLGEGLGLGLPDEDETDEGTLAGLGISRSAELGVAGMRCVSGAAL